MSLDLINDIVNKIKESDFVNNFMKELSNHLAKVKEKGENQMSNENTNSNELNEFRKDNELYQVVDFSSKGVYLQNMSTNKVFEETNIPQNLKNKIGNDYILRYKNGEYVFEEKLTDDFMNGLVDIKEYQKGKKWNCVTKLYNKILLAKNWILC